MVTKILCVALVASVMMPVGRDLYPYLAGMIDIFDFNAAEALVSATLGYAIYAAMFG
ncbi:MAG TPA: hypothetical protein VE909_03485 [Xanthobacteraceae bacterium]|nr:hypothetical protein [Xanthobacteraceae bacterium]